MKRSKINGIIADAKAFFKAQNFQLPPWAFWRPEDWQGRGEDCAEIIHNGLGWDITDFGSGDFTKRGLVLFTLRNGNLDRGDKKSYAEKIMVVEENQETPLHFHWHKMEDIINRGGGNLVLELHGSTDTEEPSDQPIAVSVDGIARQVAPGGTVVLTPGESICLEQGCFHRFYGEAGKGAVMVGEVSQVNDDKTDNNFYGGPPRFPEIEEDEAPLHLLCSDYERYL
jgi:D-lyxose ketol-isomerase